MNKEEYPNYTTERYVYHAGDIVTLDNHAVVMILESYRISEEIPCFVMKKGFGYPVIGETIIN